MGKLASRLLGIYCPSYSCLVGRRKPRVFCFVVIPASWLIGSPLAGKGCLNELYNNLETASVGIDWLRSMVAVASAMNDKSDEQTALRV